MYMRVFPSASVTAISARSVVVVVVPFAPKSGSLICVHDEPPSVERHTPRAYDDAYSVLGDSGSRTTRRTPRAEQSSVLAIWLACVPQAVVVAPLWTNVQV